MKRELLIALIHKDTGEPLENLQELMDEELMEIWNDLERKKKNK